MVSVTLLKVEGVPLSLQTDFFLETFHSGSGGLRKAVKKMKPRYHLFGHIHEAYGHGQQDGIKFFNGAVCNRKGKVANAPHVIDIEV